MGRREFDSPFKAYDDQSSIDFFLLPNASEVPVAHDPLEWRSLLRISVVVPPLVLESFT
jgi:hypothetical protein